ncbi:MAG: DUF5606 domain-containing protein [Tannerellaceae bacterium]|jgi:hypothetical protein|nr:DUF5606 domain-containing protein [Tannerellaceae bacterium]
MLKKVLSVAGRSGLYKLVSKGRNMLIAESMSDGKRVPIYSKDKVVSLAEIAVYTTTEEAPLPGILTKIREKENGGRLSIDISTASVTELRAYLREVIPDFDEARVYPSDIRKMLSWYNILLDAGIEFEAKEEEGEGTSAEGGEEGAKGEDTEQKEG